MEIILYYVLSAFFLIHYQTKMAWKLSPRITRTRGKFLYHKQILNCLVGTLLIILDRLSFFRMNVLKFTH